MIALAPTPAPVSAGYATETPASKVVRPRIPVSWFHPLGRLRVLQRLEPRLPDVAGSLFFTLTLNQEQFAHDPLAGYRSGCDRLRRIFNILKKGVWFEGVFWKIKVPYCWKLEFQENGWAHWHLIFLTKRYVPAALLEKLWARGFVKIRRIDNEDFRYLLKYVTKDNGELPAWAAALPRIRIFQGSRGFLRPAPSSEITTDEPEDAGRDEAPKERAETTSIAARLARYERLAVFRDGSTYSEITLSRPYQEIADEVVLSAAVEGRYLGRNRFSITHSTQLLPWITQN